MQKDLVRGRRKQAKELAAPAVAAKVGRVLLELRMALRKAERCRCTLREAGYPRDRWLEIVNSAAPEMRFAARPRIMDAIRSHLEQAGRPLSRERLLNEISALGLAPRPEVKHSIAANLREGNLVLLPGRLIGLPGPQKIEGE